MSFILEIIILLIGLGIIFNPAALGALIGIIGTVGLIALIIIGIIILIAYVMDNGIPLIAQSVALITLFIMLFIILSQQGLLEEYWFIAAMPIIMLMGTLTLNSRRYECQ